MINTFAKFNQELEDLFKANGIRKETSSFIMSRILPIPEGEDGFDISFKMAEDLIELQGKLVTLFFKDALPDKFIENPLDGDRS